MIQTYLDLIGHPVAVVAQKPTNSRVPDKQILWPVDLQEDRISQIEWLAENYNRVFVNLNPLKERYLEVRPAKGTSVRDCMIEKRTRILVDVDAHGGSLIEAERQLGLIKHHLGWEPLMTTYSGNGFAILYQVDMPNTSASTQLVKRFLSSLKQDFSCVDASVINPGRLTRLIGTFNVRNGERVLTRIL